MDPVGNTTSWEYDDQDRIVRETNELADDRLFEYDNNGNVVEITDRNGLVREFDYDALGRLIEERWLDGQTTVNTINSTYDAASRLADISDGFASYSYTYDHLGRVTSIDNDGTPDVPNVVLAAGYDANGRRASLAATIDAVDDFVNDYTRDNLGRITRIEQTDGAPSSGEAVADKRIDLAYNADGTFDVVSRYEDLSATDLVATSTYGYDNAGRLTSLDHDQGATSLAAYTWTYDAGSRITQFTSDDGTADYTYDNTGQLTATDFDFQTDESFSYDENGNRTNTGYTTGDNNQLETDGTYDYLYDSEGNRIRRTAVTSGDYTDYEWDHRNRLTAVEFRDSLDALTKRVEFDYDAFDRLIAKRVDDDGDSTIDRSYTFVYDGPDLILVFDDAGSLENRFLHGPAVDQVFADEDALGEILWYLGDNQQTVRDVVDYDATLDETSVVNHLTYGAFGEITSETNASLTPIHAYTGQVWDEDIGAYHYNARWYDPMVGRFLSEDPSGFAAGDSNLSRYVSNSPANFIDPTGRSAQSWQGPPQPREFGYTERQGLRWFNDSPGYRRWLRALMDWQYEANRSGTRVDGFESETAGRMAWFHVYDEPAFWQFWSSSEYVGTVAYDAWDPEDRDLAREIARQMQLGVELTRIRDGIDVGIDASSIVVRMANQPLDFGLSIGEFIERPGLTTAVGVLMPIPLVRGMDDAADVVRRAADDVVELTGQHHHAISRVVHNALENHPNLAGHYNYRDSRFMTQAVDSNAHRGWQTWHREMDAEVADYIGNTRNLTPETFEQYLVRRYNQPDMRAHFPNGLLRVEQR